MKKMNKSQFSLNQILRNKMTLAGACYSVSTSEEVCIALLGVQPATSPLLIELKTTQIPTRICSEVDCCWEWMSPDSKVHGANMGPSGAERIQVGPMLAPWTLLSGRRQWLSTGTVRIEIWLIEVWQLFSKSPDIEMSSSNDWQTLAKYLGAVLYIHILWVIALSV